MAFPTIQTADTTTGTVTSNSNTWTLTWPTNLASGDLILAFLAGDGASVPSWGVHGFVDRVNGAAPNKLSCAKKVSDGTETGTFSLAINASEQGAWRIFRITGWEGTIGTQFDNTANGGSVVVATTITGSPSAAPDPPSLDPNNWATEDTLWFAACSVDTSRTISVFPLADNQTADVSGGSNGATLGLCTLNDAVSSKDPGTFTISVSDDWATATVAVRPAAAAAYVPRHPAHDFGSITPN